MPQLAVTTSDTLLAGCGDVLPAITAEGVGVLHLGMTLGEVRAACPASLIGYAWGDEAIPEPASLARIGGAVVVAVYTDTMSGGRVERIETSDGTIHGMPASLAGLGLATMTELLGPATLAEGECVLFGSWSTHPYLSVRLRLPDGPARECGQLANDSVGLVNAQVEAAVVFRHGAA